MTAPTTELPRNTMTVIELTGPALATLRADVDDSATVLRVAVEVEPDGTIQVKCKAQEYTWSLPLEGASVTTERLYD